MHHLVLAGALCSVLCLPDAEAATRSWAEADLTNLKFILTDLDPNDGITPALTYAFVQNRGSSTSARYIQTSPSNTLRDFTWGQGLAGPVSDTVIIDYSYATSTVVGGDLWGAGAESHAMSYVYAMPSGMKNYSDSVATIGSPSSAVGDFTLTPYSSVTFTAWANTCAEASTSSVQEIGLAKVTLLYYRGSLLMARDQMVTETGGYAHVNATCNAGQLTVVVTNNKAIPMTFALQALASASTTTVLGGP